VSRERPADALWRPLAFFVLMTGFGLRLDTTWQALAGLLILGGALGGGVGLVRLTRRRRADAFVRTDGTR